VPARRSAGILLFRHRSDVTEVLLGHMGGPMWARRDRAWTIPKGEYGPAEDPLGAARREFAEEFGRAVPDVDLVSLGEVRQSGGKIVTAWAGEADFDADTITSNVVEIEWPPRSGRRLEIPEIDRAQWFAADSARDVIVAAQSAFLERIPRVRWKQA
jgi:predicted NUDIX family NTP pyrophosphohydrolase